MVDPTPEPLTPPARPSDKGLTLLVALATVGLCIVVLPFYGAVMWAAILGLVFGPLHRALARRLHGRRNLAAALTLLGVSLVVVSPLLAMGVSLAREAAQLAQAVQSGQIGGPIAAYLMATGEVWPAFGLAAFGAIVIGTIDNLLRPILVGRDTRLPDWLVLVSTIGGIALIGLNGFVIGPLVATVFIAAWGLFAARRQPDPRP